MPGQQDSMDDLPTNFAWFVLNTITRMRDADAKENYKEYFTHFRYALDALAPYIDGEKRAAIERDWEVLKVAIVQMKRTLKNDIEIKNEEVRLKKDFADKHMFHVFEALPKASIIKITQDAVIDFDKMEIETMKRIVRTGSGLEASIANATGQERKENEKA